MEKIPVIWTKICLNPKINPKWISIWEDIFIKTKVLRKSSHLISMEKRYHRDRGNIASIKSQIIKLVWNTKLGGDEIDFVQRREEE